MVVVVFPSDSGDCAVEWLDTAPAGRAVAGVTEMGTKALALEWNELAEEGTVSMAEAKLLVLGTNAEKSSS